MHAFRRDDYIPARIRQFLLPPDGMTCFYCGLLPATEIDHMIPLGQGGSSEPENLVPTCYPCNHAKLDRTIPEWFADIGRGIETALLNRFQQHRPFDQPPRKRDRFGELLDKIDLTDTESCWLSPFDEYRAQCHRRAYERLRQPLEGRWLYHCRRSFWPSICVNPDHQTVVAKEEYLVRQRRPRRPAAEGKTMKRNGQGCDSI
jgi:hypothetical protein